MINTNESIDVNRNRYHSQIKYDYCQLCIIGKVDLTDTPAIYHNNDEKSFLHNQPCFHLNKICADSLSPPQ